VALVDAIDFLVKNGKIAQSPLRKMVGSVSVGICQGVAVLDLDYAEDSTAETDMNVVMTSTGGFIEVQGTGEAGDFSQAQLEEMLKLAQQGIKGLFSAQQAALKQ
jgi:ribonuclease PH